MSKQSSPVQFDALAASTERSSCFPMRLIIYKGLLSLDVDVFHTAKLSENPQNLVLRGFGRHDNEDFREVLQTLVVR